MRLKTEYGVSHVVVVRRLNVIEEHYIFQFTRVPYHSVFADDGTAADERAVPDFGPVVNDAGCADIGRRKDLGILRNPDALRRMLKLILRQSFAQLQNKRLDFVQNFPRIRLSLKEFCGNRFAEIQQFVNRDHCGTSSVQDSLYRKISRFLQRFRCCGIGINRYISRQLQECSRNDAIIARIKHAEGRRGLLLTERYNQDIPG